MAQSVERATQLVEFVASGNHSLREISEHFGVHRSTVFRQLQTLSRAGFLLHRDDGSWGVGMRLIAIAEQALEALDLPRIARQNIRELHRHVGNTIHLAQLVGGSVVYVDKVEDPDGVRMSSRIGRSVGPRRTGVGKVILAQLSPERREMILANSSEANVWAEQSARERAEFFSELDSIAAAGWAMDDGENEEFVNCIAAPIASSTGRIEGAISISAIKAVQNTDDLLQHLDRLLETARDISRQLG